MPRIIQNKSHRRRNGTPCITLFTVYLAVRERSAFAPAPARARKHIQQHNIAPVAISTPTATPACNFVRARARIDGSRSRNPADCTSFRFSSLPSPSFSDALFHLSFVHSDSPREREKQMGGREKRNFYCGNDFQFGRRPPCSRSRRCVRTSAPARQITANVIRNCRGEFATFALNTRRRAARGNEPIRTSNKTSYLLSRSNATYISRGSCSFRIYSNGC